MATYAKSVYRPSCEGDLFDDAVGATFSPADALSAAEAQLRASQRDLFSEHDSSHAAPRQEPKVRRRRRREAVDVRATPVCPTADTVVRLLKVPENLPAQRVYEKTRTRDDHASLAVLDDFYFCLDTFAGCSPTSKTFANAEAAFLRLLGCTRKRDILLGSGILPDLMPFITRDRLSAVSLASLCVLARSPFPQEIFDEAIVEVLLRTWNAELTDETCDRAVILSVLDEEANLVSSTTNSARVFRDYLVSRTLLNILRPQKKLVTFMGKPQNLNILQRLADRHLDQCACPRSVECYALRVLELITELPPCRRHLSDFVPRLLASVLRDTTCRAPCLRILINISASNAALVDVTLPENTGRALLRRTLQMVKSDELYDDNVLSIALLTSWTEQSQEFATAIASCSIDGGSAVDAVVVALAYLSAGASAERKAGPLLDCRIRVGYLSLLLGSLWRQVPSARSKIRPYMPGDGPATLALVIDEFLEFQRELTQVSPQMEAGYLRIVASLRGK